MYSGDHCNVEAERMFSKCTCSTLSQIVNGGLLQPWARRSVLVVNGLPLIFLAEDVNPFHQVTSTVSTFKVSHSLRQPVCSVYCNTCKHAKYFNKKHGYFHGILSDSNENMLLLTFP